jgi:hypothetical protein
MIKKIIESDPQDIKKQKIKIIPKLIIRETSREADKK